MTRTPVVLVVSAGLALLLSGCGSAGGAQTSAAPVEAPGVTQAEAQAIWDELDAAFGEYDEGGPAFAQIADDKSAVESATANSFDLHSLLIASGQEDIRARVLAADPKALDFATGTGDFASYVWADGGESGPEDFPPSRDELRAGVENASDADIFHDAWLYWTTDRAEDAVVPENAEAPRLKGDPRVYDVLTDALMSPALAETRTVAVEGTDTVLVTYRARMTFDLGQQHEADWTNRYKVEKRDGRWVIVRIENLGDYPVAAIESDKRRAKERKAAAAVKPSDEELKERFTMSNVKWIGQDAQGRWWVASMYPGYSDLQVRNAPGEWEWVSGSRDMGFMADLIPAEVAAALKKAGLSVYE